MESRIFYILSVALMISGSILQNANFLSLAGIRPNLVLVLAMALAFFLKSFPVYLSALIAGLVFLQTDSLFEKPLLAIFVLGLAAFWKKRALPSRPSFSFMVFVGLATLVFDLVFYGGRFLSALPSVAGEMFYNLCLAGIIYIFFKYVQTRVHD